MFGHENFGSTSTGSGSLFKELVKVAIGVSGVSVGVIGGGYYGMMSAGTLTHNYYKRNGDPNRLRTLNIFVSMVAGATVGAIVGAVAGDAVGAYAATIINYDT